MPVDHAQGRAFQTRSNKLNQADIAEQDSERRERRDRRQKTLGSLIHGSFAPRRRGPRRGNDLSLTAVDWHHPQWLAVAILTLLLCSADALLTLTLLSHGTRRATVMLICIVYYVLLMGTEALVYEGLPPVFAAWLPNVLLITSTIAIGSSRSSRESGSLSHAP